MSEEPPIKWKIKERFFKPEDCYTEEKNGWLFYYYKDNKRLAAAINLKAVPVLRKKGA